MGKQTVSRKAMKQSVINEVAKEYKERYSKQIEYSQQVIKNLTQETNKLRMENFKLREQNNTLSEKLEKYEDWNRRLQEFLDMPTEEREQAIKEYQENKRINNALFDFVGQYEFPPIMEAYLSLFSKCGIL